MQICKYCNNTMQGEFETLKNKSYRFFYICPKCKSIYEGETKENKISREIIKSRWFNPSTKEFEDKNNY